MWQKYAFGWISNITTITYKIPQIYKIYKVKSVESISLFSLCIQVFGYIFYILHGYFNDDTTIFYGMITPLVENLILIFMYCYYKDRAT